MFRRLLLTLAFAMIAVPALQAQTQATRVYVSYTQISYGDLGEWIGTFNSVATPILESMVESGAILGFGARMHNTGSKYNLRFVLQGNGDTNFNAAWGEYLSRFEEADPAAFERGGRMTLAHIDEIWNIDELNVPADGGAAGAYFYDAQFKVNFADLEAWAETFKETLGPAIDEAMEEGLIQGYVIESHDTGGEYNWKFISIVNEWDNIDDLNQKMFGAAPLDDPIWRMFTDHRDDIWEPLPPIGD